MLIFETCQNFILKDLCWKTNKLVPKSLGKRDCKWLEIHL